MNLKIVVTSFFLILYFSSSVFASDSDQVDRAFIKYKGTEGYFFKEDIGDKLLGDIKRYELEIKKMDELTLNLKDKDLVISRLEHNISIYKEISDKWELSFVNAMDQVNNIQEALTECNISKEAWYKHPTVWFFAGFAVATASAIGLAYSLDKI